MAKKVIDCLYTFTPSTRTVTITNRFIRQEQLLLITNVTRGTVIFNFSDPDLRAASYSGNAANSQINVSGIGGVTNPQTSQSTTIVLNYNTSSMTSTDKLQIIIDEQNETMVPGDVFTDPVQKFRVSTPQAMIDTDFEYSVQPSKWEFLNLANNWPSYFSKGTGGNSFVITAISGGNQAPRSTITVTTQTAHGLGIGDVVAVQETQNQLADGIFTVNSVPSNVQFTYTAKGQISGSILDSGYTVAYGGGVYDAAGINVSSLSGDGTASNSLITVNTVNPHGLFPAMPIVLNNYSNTNLNGNHTITNVSSPSQFQFRVPATVSGAQVVNIPSTAITSVPSATLTNVSISGASGTFAFTSPGFTPFVGQRVTVTGTINAGAISGYTAPGPQTYYVIGSPSSTAFQLSATVDGAAISTTAGGTITTATFFLDGGFQVTHGTGTIGSFANNSFVTIYGATPTLYNAYWRVQRGASGVFYVEFPSNPGTASVQGTINNGRLTVAPEGFVQHRSTDGGVSITPGGNYTNVQAIRQTRRYFRYQSGKAMQFSTGWKPTPTYDIDSVTASGTTATVTTQQDHLLQAGSTVLIEGLGVTSGTNFYNGTFIVQSVTSTKAFTVTLTGTPTDTAPAGDNSLIGAFVTVTGWTGGFSRVGLFDEQNGFFFEYDGSQLFAVRRQSIKEMFGRVTVTQNSEIVSQAAGTTTRFRRQFVVGDKVVIKGQSYTISQIDSDTQMRICPIYRGPSAATGLRYLRTQEYRIPQSQWNQDPCNGTGPSGYNLNTARMQMAYIDYTWYGAGFIRFGFRGVNGEIIYCHRIPNNNVNSAAYMRSGNLPGRFEINTNTYYSKLVAGQSITRGTALASTDTTMYIENAQFWPTSGFIMVKDATNCELMQYTGIGTYNSTAGGYPLTGLVRRTTFSQAGIAVTGSFSASAFTYSGTASSVTFTPDAGSGGAGTSQVSVMLAQNTCAPVSSHWGVSCIMDGRYDNDTNYVFTVGMNRYLSVAAGATRPLLMIRIAPSVDSGNGRNFGVREIVNRMQLQPFGMDVYCNGQFLIQGVLNPSTITGTGLQFPNSWDANPNLVGSGSLSQVIYFDGTQTYGTTAATASGVITGGDRIFGFYAENSGGTQFSRTDADLRSIRDLGTSIISGNGNAQTPGYPNGPDILVITATNLAPSGTSSISTRLGWTEAQA